MNVRKSDLGVSSDTANMNAVQDANNFGTSSVATNASSFATNSGVQSVSGTGVTDSVNRDDGWSVTRNSGTTYGTNESANYGTVNSSAFGANGGREGRSVNTFTYSSGLSVASGGITGIKSGEITHQAPSSTTNLNDQAQINEPSQAGLNFAENALSISQNLSSLASSGLFAKQNGLKNQGNQTNSQTSSVTDIGKISASPTASNAALLADVTVFKFSEGKTTSFQTGNAFNINEQKGESTSINNGTRNTLSDSSNAQFIDQRGITNGRSSSDSISDLDASTHTASNGTANKVTQDRDNMVRDLGLAMAGGDAFEALRMFNTSPENRAILTSMVDKQQPHLETVLPPKQKSVAKNRDEFIGTTRDDIQKDYLASSAGVQATSDDSVQRRRAEKHIDIPTKADFMAQTTQERDLANYKMGLMAVTTSEYLQKETGILSVLERVFGGAFTYSSPQEMYAHLGAEAETNSQLRETLTEIGRVSGPGVSEQDILSKMRKN